MEQDNELIPLTQVVKRENSIEREPQTEPQTENDNDEETVEYEIITSVDVLDNDRFPFFDFWSDPEIDYPRKMKFIINDSNIIYTTTKKTQRNGKKFIEIDCLNYSGPEGEAEITFETWMLWLQGAPFNLTIPTLTIMSIGINDLIGESILEAAGMLGWKIIDDEILTVIFSIYDDDE